MATLKSNGTEILRVSKARNVDPNEGRSIIWEKVTYSYRSNGWVLTKRDVLFQPDHLCSTPDKPRPHTYPWTRRSKLKKDNDLNVSKKYWQDNGWTIETDNIPAEAVLAV